MTTFRFSPQMKQMILEAKKRGGKTACDPRAMYPVGHKCAPTTQPVTRIPQKSKPLIYDPERFRGRPITSPVPDTAVITRVTGTPDGGAVIEANGDNGDTVTADVDRNGAVREVAVRPKLFENPLVPIALGAAALLLLGG